MTASHPATPEFAPTVETVARLVHVSKVYSIGGHAVRALDDVSFDFHRGDFVAIMGSSGSGKSTLLNLLGCLDRPTTGSYILAGQDVAGMDDETLSRVRGRYLGFIFQSYNLIQQLSVLENIAVPLTYRRPPLEGAADRCLRLAELVGLSGRLAHRPTELSGGQQQRVAIARALVNNPHVILADEPTGNLDSQTSLEIMNLLSELRRSGITVIFVTHEHDIAAFAARCLSLRDGAIITDQRQ